MAKEMCRNHPRVFASGQCKQCAIPICDRCKVVKPEGIFCSIECFEKFARFQDRLAAHDSRKRRPTWGFWRAKRIASVAAAAVVFLVFAHFAYDVNSPADLPAAIGSMFHDLINLF